MIYVVTEVIVASGLKLDFWGRDKILVCRNKNKTKVGFYLVLLGHFLQLKGGQQ